MVEHTAPRYGARDGGRAPNDDEQDRDDHEREHHQHHRQSPVGRRDLAAGAGQVLLQPVEDALEQAAVVGVGGQGELVGEPGTGLLDAGVDRGSRAAAPRRSRDPGVVALLRLLQQGHVEPLVADALVDVEQ